MKQLFNKKDLIGKTIKKISGDNLSIRFTDDSFVKLSIYDITEGYGFTRTELRIDDCDCRDDYDCLVELDFITEKEYNEIIRIEDNKQKELRKKELEEYNLNIKKQELKILEELKKKYEENIIN